MILQGPPGTGKTRLAESVRDEHFAGRGMVIQFHPSVTYEDFVIGLSPDTRDSALRFDVRPGWLLQAAEQAKHAPFVLIIDEVNRADLGKILGEAVYLFEPDEIGAGKTRTITLPHADKDGRREFSFPPNLFVLATMNTADRSISSLDLAIRRRFAFVNVPPDRNVVEAHGTTMTLDAFDKLMDVFVEHSPTDTLDLMPGHAYFLAPNDATARSRFRFALLPLLDEYLREGYIGPATTELAAVRDMIEEMADGHAESSEE